MRVWGKVLKTSAMLLVASCGGGTLSVASSITLRNHSATLNDRFVDLLDKEQAEIERLDTVIVGHQECVPCPVCPGLRK
jgi:Tfp pilus assembly protein PilN